MEQKWNAECLADGWDEVLRTNAEGVNVATESGGHIPANSDYFRIRVPANQDRELRCPVEAIKAAAKAAPPVPPRPGRNLDELRRVEQATREAIEQEQARRKAQGPEPIRTKSDTVFLDPLSDSEGDPEVD